MLTATAGQAWSAPAGAPADEDAYFKLRLALTFVATSPGVPLVYYGDELRQPGAGDPDNRRFMKLLRLLSPFEQATLDVTKKLGAARARAARRCGAASARRCGSTTTSTSTRASAAIRTSPSWSSTAARRTRTQAVPVPPGVPLADGTVLHDRLGGPRRWPAASSDDLRSRRARTRARCYAP